MLSHVSTSPSEWPLTSAFDYADLLPLRAQAFLTALAPTLAINSRGDLWPHLMRGIAHRDVPMIVVGGRITQRSRRLWRPFRYLVRSTIGTIESISAVSEDDRVRWIAAGVPAHRVVVDGDPRDDEILERVSHPLTNDPALLAMAGPHTLVAGSTDQRDEYILLEALRTVRREDPRAKLILVPHDHTRATQVARAAHHRFRVTTWPGGTHTSDPPRELLVVTTMGRLADLYALGGIAYVGGGFRPGGIHSLAEPAAYGLPVIGGPFAGTSDEGTRFARANAVIALDPGGASRDLARHWGDLASEEARRWNAGLAARKVVRPGTTDVVWKRIAPRLGGLAATGPNERPRPRRSPNAGSPSPQ